MITKIIPIGNSKGIRIPNHILKQMEIENQIELIVSHNNEEIILRPIKKSRERWDMEFKKMREYKEDKLVIDDSLDLKDWEW